MSKKQEINKRRRNLCQEIINQYLKTGAEKKVVRAAFMNGSLPHGVALAWTGERDAYLVNFKKKTFKEYVRDGKFLMKRALLPVRVWVPREEVPRHISYEAAVEDGLLKPCAMNECPGCVNPGWGLTHNQFCDSLKDSDVRTYDLSYLEKEYRGEVDQYFD
jgi:hypothetical protein